MKNKHLLLKLLKLLYKNPKLILASLGIFSLIYSYEYFIARDKMTLYGVPKSHNLSSFTRVFRNDAFILGYSDIRANPLWVVYKLDSTEKTQKNKRPKSFSSDIRALSLIKTSDYTNSGYDRGHLAPNHAISSLYGKAAQEETFLMTNISPQKPNLNQHIWKRLEQLEYNKFRKMFKELWVFTGPVFNENKTLLKESFLVQVPSAFYKIYVGVDTKGKLKAFSLVIPQNVRKDAIITKYETSIDEIEKLTDLDFLYKLDPKIENTLESKKSNTGWIK